MVITIIMMNMILVIEIFTLILVIVIFILILVILVIVIFILIILTLVIVIFTLIIVIIAKAQTATQVECLFPPRALTKPIPVGLSICAVPQDLADNFLSQVV